MQVDHARVGHPVGDDPVACEGVAFLHTPVVHFTKVLTIRSCGSVVVWDPTESARLRRKTHKMPNTKACVAGSTSPLLRRRLAVVANHALLLYAIVSWRTAFVWLRSVVW